MTGYHTGTAQSVPTFLYSKAARPGARLTYRPSSLLALSSPLLVFLPIVSLPPSFGAHPCVRHPLSPAMSTQHAFVTPLVVGTRPAIGSAIGSAVGSSALSKSSKTLSCTSPSFRCVAAPRMAFSSIQGILTPDPVAFPQCVDIVVQAAYTQVFGNAHLMASEKAELCGAESTLAGTNDVRECVRALALSENYKSRFFDSVSQYRAVELAFKHILGRAAASRQEYAAVLAVLNSHGYNAFVSWFVDSDEYNENFGTQIVPYGIYKGCYSSNQLFNRSVAMRLSPSASDKGRSAMLHYCILSDDSPNWLTVAKGLPAGTEKGTGFTIGGHWQSSQRNKLAPVRKGTKIPGGVVFYD